MGQVYQGGDDSSGDFIRAAARGDQPGVLPSFSGTHGYACMTASGKFLAREPEQGWKAWLELPEEERRGGAAKLPERRPDDERTRPPSPPPGGLIFRVFYRNLARSPGGALGLATQEDFVPGAGRVNLDAQPNYLWLTEAEWKSLLPGAPRVGQREDVPQPIADRICLLYLHPVLAFCACNGWSKEARREQELRLVVEEVSGERVRLRLEGQARVGAAFDPARADDLSGPFGYEPRLWGRLEYDPRGPRVLSCDFVALGDVYGYPNTNDASWRPAWRAGRQPLGVSFELISGDQPGHRIPARVAP